MSALLKRRGEVVGGYRVLRPLGAGAEGVVYLVEGMRDRTLRTLKLLRGMPRQDDLAVTTSYYARLTRVPSVKRLRGQGSLVGQRSVGVRHWLAFDYVEGRTLADLAAQGRVGNPLPVLIRICAALQPVHRRGLAIGDFDRMRNLLVRRGAGDVVFCDLDAGTAIDPPPTQSQDLLELLSCARALYRASGSRIRPDVQSAIAKAQHINEAMQALRRLQGPPAS